RVRNTAAVAFLPPDKDLAWTSLFAQDEIALRKNVHLTLGGRIEHNDYTGNEFLPNARLGWEPLPDHFIWTAASRAVRAPSRIDRELFIPGSPPYSIAGGATFVSEVAEVYEVGYRAQPLPALSYSITLFRHNYRRLRSLKPTAAGTIVENQVEGAASGVESWASYRVNTFWRLSGGFVVLNEDLKTRSGAPDPASLASLGNAPSNWWLLRSTLDLTPRHEFDLMVRRVGGLSNPAVPAYTAVDARLGWRIRSNLEASLSLFNLFDPGHEEWGPPATRSEYGRSVFLSATWKP
ncbi:MAG: TonB-dependent receptor, partial [Betaproteobacteria bacterium]